MAYTWRLRDAGYHTVALGAVAVYALGYPCGRMLRADMVRDAARVDTSGGGAGGSFGAVRTVYRHGTAEQATYGRGVAWCDWMLLHGHLIARLCVCLCLFVFSLLSLL